jgi:hypothetical protein
MPSKTDTMDTPMSLTFCEPCGWESMVSILDNKESRKCKQCQGPKIKYENNEGQD